MSLVPEGIGVSGFDIGGVGVTLAIVLGGVIVAFVIGLFGYLIYQRAQYKLNINLWSKTGSGGVFTVDKARINRDPTTRRPDTIVLLRNKITEQYPGSDFLYYSDKGAMMLNAVVVENKLVFFRVDDIMPNPGEFKTSYKQSDFHGLARSILDARNKWSPSDFLTKYGPMLASGVLVVVVLIFMIVISNQLGTVSESIERGLTSYARAVAGGSP